LKSRVKTKTNAFDYLEEFEDVDLWDQFISNNE
jgi:hypothetical protein